MEPAMVPSPRATLALLVVASLPRVTAAQRLSPQQFRSYEPSIGTGTASPPAAAVRLPHADDYRYEGLVAGAVVLGTGSAILFHVMCGIDDSPDTNCTWLAIKGSLAGAALGGLTGALIGGMIPKGTKAGPP
jgi:predicted lipid-binding transport protein (Tim44 family)